jgi:Uncharacterised nucleotidyltransferase/Polysaccharide biosynthesis protein
VSSALDTRRALVASLRAPSASAGPPLASLVAACDPGELAGLAISEGLAGPARSRLGALLPPGPASRLATEARRDAVRHLAYLGVLGKLAARLDQAKVTWVALKGPVLAELSYPEVPRGYADLDLMVPAGRLREAINVLEGAGAVAAEEDWLLMVRRAKGELSMAVHGLPMVDLHWHLVYLRSARERWAISTEDLLERRQPVRLKNVNAWSLDPHDFLAHLALHASFGAVQQLRRLLDIERTIANGAPDWGVLVQRCRAWRVGLPVSVMLNRARRTLGAAVPEEVVQALAGGRSNRLVVRHLSEWAPAGRLPGGRSMKNGLTRSLRDGLLATTGQFVGETTQGSPACSTRERRNQVSPITPTVPRTPLGSRITSRWSRERTATGTWGEGGPRSSGTARSGLRTPPAPIDSQVAAAGAWGFGGRGVLLLANLIETPFLIRLLGPASYGLWTLLLLATNWASYADMGMGVASTRFGAGYYTRGDSRGESPVVWTALGLIAVTTGCVATAIALAAHSVMANLLHVERGLLGAGTVALRVGCAIFVLQSVAGIVNTPQVVRLRWRRWTVLTTVVNLLGTAGAPVALAVFGGGITTVAVVNLATSILLVGVNLLLAVRLQPALLHPSFDKVVFRRLLAYGGTLTVAGLALVPLTTAQRFFLADNHSTTAVAYLGVAGTLATTLQILPEQLTAPFMPGLARLGPPDGSTSCVPSTPRACPGCSSWSLPLRSCSPSSSGRSCRCGRGSSTALTAPRPSWSCS